MNPFALYFLWYAVTQIAFISLVIGWHRASEIPVEKREDLLTWSFLPFWRELLGFIAIAFTVIIILHDKILLPNRNTP